MSTEKTNVRLHVFMASCGLASRRASEKLIQEGRVLVNGKKATLGQSVSDDDTVEFNGKTLKRQERKQYLLLNKPPGYISSMSDDRGRPIAASLFGSRITERIYNVGRLDQWSSGLLLFTNDGQLASLLVHPRGQIDKEYLIETDLAIPPVLLSEFSRGIMIDGETYKADSAEQTGSRSLKIVLVEGKNREIRIVLEHFGLRALALRRVRIGPLMLEDLPEGSYRELRDDEIRALWEYPAKKGGLV